MCGNRPQSPRREAVTPYARELRRERLTLAYAGQLVFVFIDRSYVGVYLSCGQTCQMTEGMRAEIEAAFLAGEG